jgi:hypothetical protein
LIFHGISGRIEQVEVEREGSKGARTMYEKEIEVKARELPEHLRRQVLDFMEFLSRKYKGDRRETKFKFDWEDGLSELRDKVTAIELQHSALEWR